MTGFFSSPFQGWSCTPSHHVFLMEMEQRDKDSKSKFSTESTISKADEFKMSIALTEQKVKDSKTESIGEIK